MLAVQIMLFSCNSTYTYLCEHTMGVTQSEMTLHATACELLSISTNRCEIDDRGKIIYSDWGEIYLKSRKE
jgi:hypothetical protein